jgi:uncharacterized phosphatase
VSIALVRHGRTRWNAERRLQGRADLPLDEEGHRQALVAAGALSGGSWTRVVCSPLVRARRTAEIVAEELGLPAPALEPLLLERDYGDAEGVPVNEALERWPDGAYPGGETSVELDGRSGRALALLATPGTVIVGHGAFLRSGIAALTRRPFPRIANGEVVVLDVAGAGFRVADALADLAPLATAIRRERLPSDL